MTSIWLRFAAAIWMIKKPKLPLKPISRVIKVRRYDVRISLINIVNVADVCSSVPRCLPAEHGFLVRQIDLFRSLSSGFEALKVAQVAPSTDRRKHLRRHDERPHIFRHLYGKTFNFGFNWFQSQSYCGHCGSCWKRDKRTSFQIKEYAVNPKCWKESITIQNSLHFLWRWM